MIVSNLAVLGVMAFHHGFLEKIVRLFVARLPNTGITTCLVEMRSKWYTVRSRLTDSDARAPRRNETAEFSCARAVVAVEWH